MRLMLLRAPTSAADRSVIGKLIDGQILRSRLHSNAPIRPNAFSGEMDGLFDDGAQSSSVDQYSETPPEHLATVEHRAEDAPDVHIHQEKQDQRTTLGNGTAAEMGRVPRAGCATRCRPYGARW